MQNHAFTPDLTPGNYCYMTDADHVHEGKHTRGNVFIVCRDDPNKYAMDFQGTRAMIRGLNKHIGLSGDQVTGIIVSSIKAHNIREEG